MKNLNELKTLNNYPICSLINAPRIIIQFCIIIIFKKQIFVKYFMFALQKGYILRKALKFD